MDLYRLINQLAVIYRRITSIKTLNRDRWLPKNVCFPDSNAGRPDYWSYGVIDGGDIVFRPGYNCRIKFIPAENKVQIMPEKMVNRDR